MATITVKADSLTDLKKFASSINKKAKKTAKKSRKKPAKAKRKKGSGPAKKRKSRKKSGQLLLF